MTSCTRSNSPILKRLEGQGRRQRELVTDEEKIHRIVLSGASAICKLAHIQSPNCIWFKLHNHITDQLQIHLTEPLNALELINSHAERKNAKRRHESGESASNDDEGIGSSFSGSFSSEIQLYKYVMAPLEQNVYARGRVTQLIEVVNARSERCYQFSYVHFIDEGYGAWMNSECLAKMDPKLYWHPWQAFPISLFKFGHVQSLPKSKKSVWPVGLSKTLERIMVEYDSFRVEPVWESRRFCQRTYSDYVRANVYGVRSDNGETCVCEEQSIAHRLALEYSLHHSKPTRLIGNMRADSETNCGFPLSSLFTRSIFDATQQNLLCEPNEELTDDLLSGGIPRWRFVKPKFL